MNKSALVAIIIALLNSSLLAAGVTYVRNRKKLPHEIDSIVASTANQSLMLMSLLNKTQAETIQQLRDEATKLNTGIFDAIVQLESEQVNVNLVAINLRKLLA
jgi:hypothetical protein